MPIEIQKTGRRKLRMLNNSQAISDWRILSSNRLGNGLFQFAIKNLSGCAFLKYLQTK